MSRAQHPTILTERLVLRMWQPNDRTAFAAMNSDPEVMEFFPSTLTAEASDAFVDRIEAGFAANGYGLWATATRSGGDFIGFVGLSAFRDDEPTPLPFAPGVEIGWRLARAAWGKGYAPEAALAVLGLGFGEIGLEEIVSFTAAVNQRSRRVMEKIGMHRDEGDDFDHPRVEAGSTLRRHVLYRISRAEWPA